MGRRWRCWGTLISGFIECLCFAGVIFGWTSLVFVLKEDGYFSELCVNVTAATTDCRAQDERFSLVFTIASFLNNFLMLPAGFIFDYFGTTATRLLAIGLYTTGSLVVALSTAETAVLIFPALSLIAIGGMLLLMSNMQVGNLFGSHRSTVITLYNGAFDSSAVIFLIVKVLFEGGVSLSSSFFFLFTCNIIHILRTLFLMPRTHIPYPLPENYTYGMRCSTSRSYNLERAKDQLDNGGVHRVSLQSSGTLPSGREEEDVPSFRCCFRSPFFLWHLLWMSIMQLRHYLFIGTLNPMLSHLSGGDPVLVSRYTNAFGVTQLCGALCAPWNGLLMDHYKGRPRAPGQTAAEVEIRSSVASLSLTALQCVLFSICAAVPVLPLQYLTFALQVLNRSFLYGGSAAFLSLAFPMRHFGKLHGLLMALSAVVSLLQYPCFTIVKELLDGDPLYVNVALTLLMLLPFLHPLYVYRYCKQAANLREGVCSDSTHL